MPRRPNGPVRRGQLIAPFGVGALVIAPGGVSLIVGGLDNWYEPRERNRKIDVEEFKIKEWRLQKLLNVDHFRLPPDYRETFWAQGNVNTELTIPAYRFPTWHFCPGCRLLHQLPMYASGKAGRIKCPECESVSKSRYMFQVPFVAMCERGHLQDFPWREWVHGEDFPICNGRLRLISTGGATLAGQKIKCDGCKRERTLAGITTAYPSGGTLLSKSLRVDGTPFHCQGRKSWLGEGESEQCTAPLRGSLRSAANLYFAQTVSSIYLPTSEDKDLQRLEDILQNPPVSTLLDILKENGVFSFDKQIAAIRKGYTQLVIDYSDDQLIAGLKNISNQGFPGDKPQVQDEGRIAFRRAEFSVLRSVRDDSFLKIRQIGIDEYDRNLSTYFSKISLVGKLRETRVLSGFTRVFSQNDESTEERQKLLWKEMPAFSGRWLPAYTVYGEGLFFEFEEKRLQHWETGHSVVERTLLLVRRFDELHQRRHLVNKEISPRFILIHTFSHLVMNRLVFECGYSSAALRERIYTSNHPDNQMAGLLIYTADGDSEGTMGVLVRMGKPGFLEPIIQRALESAKWCSADPVCMELGSKTGQGPDSCNLAACHNCALVPETACEEFNRFLDRGLLFGNSDYPERGYFDF
jgi:hypothetical protein